MAKSPQLKMEAKELYQSLIKALKELKKEPNSLFYKGQTINLKQMILEKVGSESKEDYVSHLIALGFASIGFKEAYFTSDDKELNEAKDEFFSAIESTENKFPNSIAKMAMDAIGLKID